MCTEATEATLFELVYENGKSVRKTYKQYTDPVYTTAEGITSILNDVRECTPAQRYSMIIGCHGMGWIPVSNAQSNRHNHTCSRYLQCRIENGIYTF